MALRPGMNVGPYRIEAPIGAGGMGEVYRARDTRLERDVALKIIATGAGMGADRIARFEREAHAVAALNHPNILAVHDVGTVDESPYVVFELLEGETLKERLARGALPVRKVLELGIQISRGLAAAHARGIIHRDLKPANLFVTSDGQMKILDFGLALEAGVPRAVSSQAETAEVTAAGAVVGTPAYMSPEQARGQRVDARSDLFSLGAILYEMLTGRRAFEGVTSADVLTGILTQDPAEMSTASGVVPPVLERVVRRCLEKNPEERFQSARDVGFALDAASGTTPSGPLPPEVAPAARRPRGPRVAVQVAVLLVVGALALLLGRVLFERPVPKITQLTDRSGLVDAARFTSDGQTIVYSALWDGRPPEIFTVRLDDPDLEPRSLGLPPARLMSVSSQGELAILLTPPGMVYDDAGTLARVALAGGEPRPVLEDVVAADWSPDGRDLAVLRLANGACQLEYPIGHVLARQLPADLLPYLRVSPDGDRVLLSSYFSATIFDRDGTASALGRPRLTAGAAWASNDAIWVSGGTEQLVSRSLWKVTPSSGAREVYPFASAARVMDASPEGRVLVQQGTDKFGTRVRAPGQSAERELVSGMLSALSSDGTTALLYRSVAPKTRTFLEPTRGGPAVRLGDGWGAAFSPDGHRVLLGASVSSPSLAMALVPTGPGEARTLPLEPVERLIFQLGPYAGGSPDTLWFVDDGYVAFAGAERDRRARGYLLNLATGAIRAITPEEVLTIPHSLADGRVLGVSPDGRLARYPLAGGERETLEVRLPAGFSPLRASADGRFLYVRRRGVPCRVERLDLATGQQSAWLELHPEGFAGVNEIWDPQLTADGAAYAYSYFRKDVDLFLFEGLR